jgi:hypothetical protein
MQKYVIAFILKNKCGYETRYHYPKTYEEMKGFLEMHIQNIISWYPGKFIRVLYAGAWDHTQDELERTFTCDKATFTFYKYFSLPSPSPSPCASCNWKYFNRGGF